MEATLDRAKQSMARLGYLNIPVQDNIELVQEIQRIKREKNAIILAHYYQPAEVQDIADFIGDSLGLSQEAAKTNADIIVFAGVHFMAETAKILNPSKKVLLPDLKSGCSLAEACPPERLRAFIDKHPDHVVVTYINCSAEVKAMSDVVCTSANAERVINSIPKGKSILFAPDKNLGDYLIRKTGRKMLLWDGACVVHEAFSIEKLVRLHVQYPDAAIVAHPESSDNILKVAHYVGSTTGMINFVRKDARKSFIIATEAGILHQMKKEVPGKQLMPAPVDEDNTCACSECAYMRLTTLEKIYNCLRYELPEITVPLEVAKKALFPIQRMLSISAN